MSSVDASNIFILVIISLCSVSKNFRNGQVVIEKDEANAEAQLRQQYKPLMK